MAAKNPGDVLTGDWNPVIGCQRCSPGCQKCWFFDSMFSWQQRLHNIPAKVHPNVPHVFEERLTVESLRSKNGIVGVCQHGDLFWNQISDATIHRVLDVMEAAAARKRKVPKYVLWTKRPERMAEILCHRYPEGTPSYLACAVSIENQAIADERLPHLLSIPTTRIAVLEPLLGPVTLGEFVRDLHWVIVGSETGGEDARSLDCEWVEHLREEATQNGVPFFVKQLNKDHRKPIRELDGVTWSECPAGFVK